MPQPSRRRAASRPVCLRFASGLSPVCLRFVSGSTDRSRPAGRAFVGRLPPFPPPFFRIAPSDAAERRTRITAMQHAKRRLCLPAPPGSSAPFAIRPSSVRRPPSPFALRSAPFVAHRRARVRSRLSWATDKLDEGHFDHVPDAPSPDLRLRAVLRVRLHRRETLLCATGDAPPAAALADRVRDARRDELPRAIPARGRRRRCRRAREPRGRRGARLAPCEPLAAAVRRRTLAPRRAPARRRQPARNAAAYVRRRDVHALCGRDREAVGRDARVRPAVVCGLGPARRHAARPRDQRGRALRPVHERPRDKDGAYTLDSN
ncbi:hypothetical protein Y033_1004 [Burkholderia pseudomallei MSHR435]|nr:hypothetical protein BG17_4860 [Burkholderia pseudomallei MSHR491]KGW92730.1 hypothetical protein Y034_2168 [Burkholderia pseudomallei MSHR449]KGX74612.1 hypothetical protein Y033_1004 [Burkholderia pseudomallei MSHR435]